jgi:arsenite methyltransferase
MYQKSEKNYQEFNSVRSKNYRDAVKEADIAWAQDMQIMQKYLSPTRGDTVLEIGAGSGFFSFSISDAIGTTGKIYVTDPSAEQMSPIYEKKRNNMELLVQQAEDIDLGNEGRQINKFWSRGAFHHVANKTLAMQRWRKIAAPKAKLVIFDIFSCSDTALFFDAFVARACITGHEVSFLNKAFATSLCAISGWKPPIFVDIPLRWRFSDENSIGIFLSKLLSNKDSYSPADSLVAAQRYLGVQSTSTGFELNWPMTVMISEA